MPKTSIVKCETCGKVNETVNGKYCSRKCYTTARRTGIFRTAPRKPCVVCGAEIIATQKKRCCSIECLLIEKRKGRDRVCEYCKKEYTAPRQKANKRFCSDGCRRKGRKPGAIKCQMCGVLFSFLKKANGQAKWYRTMPNNTIKCCSLECATSYTSVLRTGRPIHKLRGENNPRKVAVTHNRGVEWRERADKVRERDQHKCTKCGIGEKEHRIKYAGHNLDVHHITPKSHTKAGDDSERFENLVTLCKSCHTKADMQWRKRERSYRPLRIDQLPEI